MVRIRAGHKLVTGQRGDPVQHALTLAPSITTASHLHSYPRHCAIASDYINIARASDTAVDFAKFSAIK